MAANNFDAALKKVGSQYCCLELIAYNSHIALPYTYLGKVKESIATILTNILLRFSQKLDGVPLAFNNKKVKLTSKVAQIYGDQSCIHFDVVTELILFKPKIGDVIKAKVNRVKQEGQFSCLIHEYIYAFCTCSDAESSVKVGDVVLIKITQLEHDGFGLLSIRSELKKILNDGDMSEEYTVGNPDLDSGIDDDLVSRSFSAAYDDPLPVLVDEKKKEKKKEKKEKKKKKKKEKQRNIAEDPDNVEKLSQSVHNIDNTSTAIVAVEDAKHKKKKKKEKRREKDSNVDNNLQSINSDVNQLIIDSVIEQNVAPLADEESITEPHVEERKKKKKKEKKEKEQKARKSDNERITPVAIVDSCKEMSTAIEKEPEKVADQMEERKKKKKKKEKRVKKEVAEIIEVGLEPKNVKSISQNEENASMQITEKQSKRNKRKEESLVESRQTPTEIIVVTEETQITRPFLKESSSGFLSADTASLKTWLNSSQSSVDTDDLEESVMSFKKKKKKKSKTHEDALLQNSISGVKISNDTVNGAQHTEISQLQISAEVIKLENTKMADVVQLKDAIEISHLPMYNKSDGSEMRFGLFEPFDSPNVSVPFANAGIKDVQQDIGNLANHESLTAPDLHFSSLSKADKKQDKVARREEKRKRREEKEQRRLLKTARKEARRLEREERRKQRNFRREEKKKRKEEKRQRIEAKRQIKEEKKRLKEEKRLKKEEKKLQKQKKERRKVEKKEQKKINNEEKEQILPVRELKLNKKSLKIKKSNSTPMKSKQTEIDTLSNSPNLEFQALVKSLNSQNNVKTGKKRKLNDIESNVLAGISSPNTKRKKQSEF